MPASDLEQIADQTGDIFVRVDPTGRMSYVSGSIRQFGYTPEELVGTSGAQIVHPDDLEQFIENSKSAFRGERQSPDDRVHRFRTADGHWVWMEGNPRVVRDEAGQVLELVNVFRNVSDRRRVQSEALAQAQLFRTAFEHEGVGKALVGLDGRFLDINAAFCDLLGYAKAALLALDFQTITHPDDLDADLSLLARLNAGEIPSYRMDKRYLRADGAMVEAHLTVSMARDEAGAPKLYVAQVQDQTRQRAAELALRQSESRYRLLADNATDIIACFGPDARFTYLSPSVKCVLGYAPEELVGRPTRDIMHPDDYQASIALYRAQLAGPDAGQPFFFEYRAFRKDGAMVWLAGHPRPVFDPATGALVEFQDVVRDVTVRRAMEEALRHKTAEAEAAAVAKADFLANMSHEIRTPLTAIIGFSGMLAERGDLAPDVAGMVGRIGSASDALLALVNDILDFSKLEAGQVTLSPRPTNLEALCQDALELLSTAARRKGIALAFDRDFAGGRFALVDADRMRQVLINLISNAVKFTETGAVRLAVRYDAGRGRLRVRVADSGPGLDKAQRQRLFQRFSQVDASSTRRHGGTGLGLAICKGLIEAMGGRIGVASRPGRGSVFHFTIKAPSVAEPARGEDAGRAAALGALRVLVVDDNPVNRELARAILEASGAEVSEAHDGASGLAALALHPVDVVLLDLRMPDIDGREVLRQLRSTAGPNRYVPALAFSADIVADRVDGAAHFDGRVRKPIVPAALIGEVARVLDGDLDEPIHAVG